MQEKDQDSEQKSTSVGGGGSSVHVCHRCRWPFSNAHPSQKKRAAHKKHCGKMEGYPLVIAAAECDGERVEEGSVGSFSNGSSVTINFEEMTLEEEKNLENAGANLEVKDMIEAETFEEANKTPNPGGSEAEDLERNDMENNNMKIAKYGDIAAKQLDRNIEFQDNMSLDCSMEVASSFQANNDSFDCSMEIRYPLQPKSDLLLARNSIHEKDLAVDLERNDTENDNTKIAKYGDIAAKQLDSNIEYQDNMSLDCSTEVASSFQANNDLFDCFMEIGYPPQPKSDLLLAQNSIHEKDSAVDLEDKELACIMTSTMLPEYSASNLEGIDLKLHVPQEGKVEPGGECELGISSMDLLVTSCNPVIIACPSDATKCNQIEITSENLSNYSLSPRTNVSRMNIEAPEHAKPVDVASLFSSSSAEVLIQPVNQSEYDLEGMQIDTILLPHLPALDIHVDEAEDLNRVSAHSNNPEAHNDGETPIFVGDIRELYKAEILVAKVNDVLEDITCDNSEEVHLEDHGVTSNDVITSSVQLQVDKVEDFSGKVASCLDLSPDIFCQDDIQNRNSTFDYGDACVVEEKMGCHTNNGHNDSENDSHASQLCEEKEMQNNKKLCIQSGFDKHIDEDNSFYHGCTDLGNDALKDTANDSLASQKCEEKDMQNNQKLCIESGFDTHTDEGNAFCHRSIYLGNDAINNTENDSLAPQECEEKEMQNNQKLYLESGFDTHNSEVNVFYHGGTNLGNDDIRENEFKGEEPTESTVCPNIDVTKNQLDSISHVGLTLHDIDMDNTQKRSMLTDANASVSFTLEAEAGIERDESESPPEQLNDHLNSNHGNQVGINCYDPKHPMDNGCGDQSKTIQPSQDSNSCKEANICTVSEEASTSIENQPSTDNFLNNDKENSDDLLVFVDASDGTIDQREGTEGYCVPKCDKLGANSNSSQENACNSLSDVPSDPDSIETGQQLTDEIRPIDTDEQPTSMSRNMKLSPQNKANESHGWKKKDEIKSRVVDWQHLKDGIVEENKKPHVPLKNLLGKANQEGKNSLKNSLEKIVLSPAREADTLQNGYSEENIQRSMNESERSPIRDDAKVMQKEWNSPARLPVNKNTKGKAKGKLQWTPFMCCSSNAI